MQGSDRWNTQHGHTANKQLTAPSPPSYQQLSLRRGKASLPCSLLEGTVGAITYESCWDISAWLSLEECTALPAHPAPSDPGQPPVPATSLPFIKSSCPQPNPLTLSLSYYSIFKLMPGQAWDRRKLTLGRGSSLHSASYHLKHCSLPFSHSICRGDTGSTTITASITQAQALRTHLCWWGGKPPSLGSPLLGRLQGPQEIPPAVLGFTPKTASWELTGSSFRAACTLAGTFWSPQFWSKKPGGIWLLVGSTGDTHTLGELRGAGVGRRQGCGQDKECHNTHSDQYGGHFLPVSLWGSWNTSLSQDLCEDEQTPRP